MKRFAALLAIVLFAATALAQGPKPVLTVQGKNLTTVTFTADDLAKLPHVKVLAPRGHKPEKVEYEGIPLKAILEKAAVLNAAKPLHGKQLLQYVVFTASDGYRVLFSLAELEEVTGGTSGVILADKIAGQPLTEKEAPLQLVVPTDKRPERFARMITTITVASAE